MANDLIAYGSAIVDYLVGISRPAAIKHHSQITLRFDRKIANYDIDYICLTSICKAGIQILADAGAEIRESYMLIQII